MIELEAYNARTFFSGRRKELRRMFHCLRVRDKNSYFRAQATIKALAYRGVFYGMDEKERKEKMEEITQSAQWVKFYDRRTDSFASGLLPRVQAFLKKREIEYRLRDRRKENPLKEHRFHRVHFLDKIEARPEQVKVIQNALSQGRGILHCATNFGKTEVACAIAAEFLHQTGKVPRILFLIHRKQLVVQTMERFQKHLGKQFPTTMIGAGMKEIPNRGALIATVQTASLLLKSFRFEDFMEKCDILFIDEFHINKAWQAYRIVNRCNAPLRFGLSGTIDKENKIKIMHYMGMTGPIIAEVKNKELVDLGRSARPMIRMVEVHIDPVGGNYAASYKMGVVRSRDRNRLVIREILRYVGKNYRTLVTVARISHGLRIRKILERKTDFPVEFLSGSTQLWKRGKVIKKFEAGKIPVLIASPIFDVGVDIPAIDAWVNAAGGKGWELVLQRLGRVLRKKEGKNRVYISDFVDFHNEYLLQHSMRRVKYYRDEEIAEIKVVEK